MTKSLLRFLTVISCVLGIGFSSIQPVIAQTDVGYKDFTYTSNIASTGEKPQSKLWYNDGLWWGVLYNFSATRFEIYRFDWITQGWSTTGTRVDLRQWSSADVLWTGTKLYIAASMTPGATGDQKIYFTRYSYAPATKTYSLDPSFPIFLWPNATETVVIDQDEVGMIWATFTDINSSGGRNVYVTHSTTNDATWKIPYVIPTNGASNLTSDDISTIVAFNGKIGVMWSNQTESTIFFATHENGQVDDAWVLSPALQGPKYADDHLNIKSLQADSAGQVFAAVKTSLSDIKPPNPNDPEILLLTLDSNGSWRNPRIVARVGDNHTRPIVLIDNQNRQVYVFMTYLYPTQMTGAIYYKQASLDNPSMQFPDGLGIPFIKFSAYTHINNASSTKQALNGTTDLLVIASDDVSRFYFHNVIDLPNPVLPASIKVYLPLILR